MVLLFGSGFMLIAGFLGVVLLCFVEFPLRRGLQYLVLPYISHDDLLREHYEKQILNNDVVQEIRGSAHPFTELESK